MSGSWSGRKVPRLVALTLETKGTVCHLCSEPGATSADHDPPRSVLAAAGTPDPDDLAYLWPAHLVCNQRRRARDLTAELRSELRSRYLADTVSPVLARRRPIPHDPYDVEVTLRDAPS